MYNTLPFEDYKYWKIRFGSGRSNSVSGIIKMVMGGAEKVFLEHTLPTLSALTDVI